MTPETNEQLAMKIGNSATKLRQRLERAIGTMFAKDAARFTPRNRCRLDFENKRLYSTDGKLYLQWRLRDRPDLPDSYKNQQTSVGTVSLHINGSK